ncbi:glycine N-methyltransferase [Hydra vulgaris]|uniref:Glycine N-methyltransferase n=1 Tax=Hydra vulgaris TaxID=6087 RepID=A0ABM4CH76_HYDVU
MDEKIDGVFRTRTLGIGARGIPDQYADGKAARVWHKYIGDEQQRTGYYKDQLVSILKEHNCQHVLDVACGTGIDSVLLLEEGFKVTSVDASDKMLKYALKKRWDRRKEPAFDNWVIEEGNWLRLKEADIKVPGNGFDAIICMGNSFAHLPDFDGTQKSHRTAITNFYDLLRPGGILLIDHRNYDTIVKGHKAPMKNIYYQSKSRVDCKTSVLMVDGSYHMVTLDYIVYEDDNDNEGCKFRLSYYPHLLSKFDNLIDEIFGEGRQTVLADFKKLDEVDNPSYFIHICKKKE